jgi:hypothetical protein
LDPEIKERVDEILKKYSEGVLVHPIFTGCLKDEARSFEKIEACKTRMFAGAPMDWTVVVRMMLMSFVQLAQSKPYLFELFIGTDCGSFEWENLYNYLTAHGENNIIAGDFGNFDQSMVAMLLDGVAEVILAVCATGRYTDKELQKIECIFYDLKQPYVLVMGDLLQLFGFNPSGQPLTAVVNSLANSLYMRYCYYLLNPEEECTSFKENVNLATYGDDNIMGVSKRTPWFNHSAIAEVLSTIDVKYTMAEKTAESRPYIHISEATFLKRSWRYDPDVKAIVAPLEKTSIDKSLLLCVRSKSITLEEQTVEIVKSAVCEYFHYGRKVFESKRQELQDAIEAMELQDYVKDSTFPTWEQLLRGFWERSKDSAPPHRILKF